ncbi:hypothetical protein [Lactiplantibacillus plantarum]|uniref:hypothetical protein n=1 Tax=Lactiplantibacillus plantarum TaxID=1590 RepID=UPI000978C102|nr:hypothetical protein [Lactiplantibacillus plantarum]GJI51840.1 hypothetical protein NMZ1139_00680 [Lactiplantibacillus plantarum]
MISNTTQKKFDFFAIYRHTSLANKDGFDENGDCFDLTPIDMALLDRFKMDETKLNLVKLGQTLFAGITHIRLIYLNGTFGNKREEETLSLDTEHVWVFNIEKANTLDKAVIVDINESVGNGRTEYGDDPDEGAARDTVVCFNPSNGVIVVPPRSAMGVNMLERFFTHITTPRTTGLYDDVVRDSTGTGNIAHLSGINEIDLRVSNLSDTVKHGNVKKAIELSSHKMSLKLYDGGFTVAEAADYVKKLFMRQKNKEVVVEKLLIDGEYNDTHQLIDLVDHRMIATVDVPTNRNGKVIVDAMMDAVYSAYTSNRTKLDISHAVKGGNGV